MLVSCRTTTPAPEEQVAAEVQQVLDRRAAQKHPPVTMAVSDSVALGIAGIFGSPTRSGQVLRQFHRTGSMEATALLEAAAEEQGFASAEGHAALYCLMGWVRSQLYKRGA